MKKCIILPLISAFWAASLGFATLSSGRSISTPFSSYEPLLIAVTPFTNLSGQKDYDWLSVGIGEVFTTKLGSLSCFNLVERIKLSEALREIELGQTGLIDENTAPKVGKMIGAEGLVVGSFQIIGQTIRIDARLLDVETGKVHVFAGAYGELDKIFEAQDRIAASFLAALNAPLTDEERFLLEAKPTTSMEAFKLYSQAADTYTPEGNKLDDDQRIYLLNQSTRIDANFAMAYAGLGYIYAVKKQDYPRAVVNYNRVVILQPYNPAPRIWLTRIYMKQGNPSAALQEQRRIDELKRRPPSGTPDGQTGSITPGQQWNVPAAPRPLPSRVQPLPNSPGIIAPPPGHFYPPSPRPPGTKRAPKKGKGGKR